MHFETFYFRLALVWSHRLHTHGDGVNLGLNSAETDLVHMHQINGQGQLENLVQKCPGDLS